MKRLLLTDDEITVLLQSLKSVGWPALPPAHPERKAAATVEAKLQSALEKPGAAYDPFAMRADDQS